MDPAVVAELRRKYSGLDDKLVYISGSTIYTKYEGYKQADLAAQDASKAYKTTAASLKQGKPYPPEVRTPRAIMNNVYTTTGHRTMAPLAESASSKAGFHAARRESFNVTYEDVLVAKNNYKTHVDEAKAARTSEKKYAQYGTSHRKYAAFS